MFLGLASIHSIGNFPKGIFVMKRFSAIRQSVPFGWRVMLVVLMAGVLTGCKYLLFVGYLVGGPPSVEPKFDQETGLSMTDKDITVAVVCYAPKKVKWDHANVDHDLAKYVANRMYGKKIVVINPDRVRAWLDEHPNWDSPEEIGAYFHVDYVVHIEVNKMSLYEKNSSQLYRGRSEVLVNVWQMDGEEGEQIFTRDIESEYPRAMPRSAYDTTYPNFKRDYMAVLSEDIGQLFYEHYNGEDIHNAY